MEDANKFLDDAVNEKAPLEVEVEKLSTKLEESQRQLRELRLQMYQEDLRTRDIHSRFDKIMDQLEKEQENRLFDADIFKEKERVLREFIDTLETQLKKGNFTPLREWLRKNIHAHGKTYSSAALVKEVTGEPLHAQYFIRYLEEKYGEIYDLPRP